jgi:hypothetical protein
MIHPWLARRNEIFFSEITKIKSGPFGSLVPLSKNNQHPITGVLVV